MGRFLKGAGSTAALGLTGAAVLLPCALWYVLGSRHLNQVAVELQQGAKREATTTAMQLATKLALQLEDMRRSESDRIHLDYFPRYLWRGPHCGSLKLRASELATGDYPYAVLFYFQLDENGTLTSPRGDAVLAGLEVPDSIRVGTRGAGSNRPGSDKPVAGSSVIPSAVTPWHLRSRGQSVEPQPAQSPAGLPLSPLAVDPSLPAVDDAREVGQFRWYTGKWRGQPTLMAIRSLRLRGHDYRQGFAIDSASLSDWMFDGGFPARLVPGVAGAGGQVAAALPIGGAAWHVEVDPARSLALVEKQAATLRSQFLTSYCVGLLSAILAGACVMALVWRSARLANERSRFAAATAHELRTPLAGIRLHGEMLASSLGNPGSVKRYAQRITDEADRLGRVVANVLSYTRDDQKRLQIAASPGDIAATVRECLSNSEPVLTEAGARVDVELDDLLPQITFDPDAVHQILRNLLDNAEKYTRAAADRRIEVTLGLGVDDDSVALRVADHGPGIAPHLRARLFRPFGQAGAETHTAGLGLGLGVVHALSTAHGGRVEYSDTPGGGATFTVTLPRIPRSLRSRAPAA